MYSTLKQRKKPFYFLVHNQRKEIKTQFPLDSLSPNNICQGFPRASNSSSFGKLVFLLCAAKFHRSGKKGIFQRNPKSAFFPRPWSCFLAKFTAAHRTVSKVEKMHFLSPFFCSECRGNRILPNQEKTKLFCAKTTCKITGDPGRNDLLKFEKI